MNPAPILLVLAAASAAAEPLVPVVREGPSWNCERVAVAFLARVVEDEFTDSPRLEIIEILRGDPFKVPERVKLADTAADWRGVTGRILVGLDEQGRNVCQGGETGGYYHEDDLAYPTGVIPTTRGSPERLDARVRYLQHVWRLLEEPRVRDVLALLESDDLAARSAAHTVLAMTPSPHTSPFWADVGAVLVRQLPKEPKELSDYGKVRFTRTLQTAVYATGGFASQPELRRGSTKLLAEMYVGRDGPGNCDAMAMLGHPEVCKRDRRGGRVASPAAMERLRRELAAQPPK